MASIVQAAGETSLTCHFHFCFWQSAPGNSSARGRFCAARLIKARWNSDSWLTGSWIQLQFGKELPDSVEVPDFARPAITGHGQVPAVRTPRQPADGARLLAQRIEPPSAFSVPDFHANPRG